MSSDRMRQIEELFHAVREGSAERRAALLARADPEVRREVESLLARQSDDLLLDRPAVETMTQSLAGTGASVAVGTCLGPYRIEGKLGAGGMGEVFRAVDTRLGRSVAIKTTHAHFSARFEREARAISALNHPNICTLYDVGPDYLVMELVEGETLAERLKRGPLPLDQVLHYGWHIVAALIEAHGKGIIHRDLKPGNIMIGKSGVKVLDFGLARSGQDETVTVSQMIVGTPAYMAPEQREGKPSDARTDIYAFGRVLFEMLTGARVGPQEKRIRPRKLERIVARCLEDDPARRWQSAAELQRELWSVKPARLRTRIAIGATAILVLAAVAGLFWSVKRTSAPARIDWVQITNFADSVGQPALSPDGRMLAFVRGGTSFPPGPGEIYVKMLPSGDPVQLTRDGSRKMSPAFSPDGSRIAYSVISGRDWDTWVVPVLGGEPRLWLPNASGLVWFDKSKLLFSEIKDGPLHMALVTAEESRAGSRDIYVPPHQRGMAHRSFPSPDSKSILIVEMNESAAIVPCRLVPMDGKSPGQQVGPPGGACTFAGWSRDGTWMYFSSDAGGVFHTWRQRFPDGLPEQITSGPTDEEGIAVAPDGSLLTAVGARQSSVWVHDSRGDRQISLEGQAFAPRFAPDGKKLCYLVRTGNSSELWVADLESNHTEPLLAGFPVALAAPGAPVVDYDISPDGKQVVFFSRDRDGKFRLWITPFDRRSPPRQVPSVEGEQPLFGPNGEIFFRKVEGSSAFLNSVREDGSGLRRASDLPLISMFGTYPDRKWLLIGVATEGEVVFPAGGGAPLVTHAYPFWLRWTGDGKDLFVCSAIERGGRTYVLPLSAGHVLPGSIALAKNFPTEEELAKMHGVRIIPVGDAVPGPTADIYAFTRETTQRNVYRIPVP
jgi:Tol biopolymer transport system component